jgi:hypothetical protein
MVKKMEIERNSHGEKESKRRKSIVKKPEAVQRSMGCVSSNNCQTERVYGPESISLQCQKGKEKRRKEEKT